MENSLCSSPNKTLISSPSRSNGGDFSDHHQEESGWTQYLQDFSNYNRGDHEEEDEDGDVRNSTCSNLIGDASMVSDARSGPEWKQRRIGNLEENAWANLANSNRKLSLKNKRTKEISYDDSLEDTASSPVNSPKISLTFKKMDINSRRTDDYNFMESFQGKGKREEEMKQNENKNKKKSEYEDELRKKGLCLVPVSVAMNYLV